MTEIKNKKAYFDYYIEDEIECGISLKGTEVKSIREGLANIKDSYAIIRNNGLGRAQKTFPKFFIDKIYLMQYNWIKDKETMTMTMTITITRR